MTWLRGQTTWGALSSDLTKLICGEITDGVGTTCASGDQWVRETVGVDVIRTPAPKDVASGSMSNRSGYYALTLASTESSPMVATAGGLSVCRVTTPFTSDPSVSGFHRWTVVVTVQTVNSVAGNYSTARVNYTCFDADSGTTLFNQVSIALSSGGLLTMFNGHSVTLSDPSGFLAFNTTWRRSFTSTYMYGIDYWPMYHRRSAAVTFSVNPSGVAGTDYDIVEIVPPHTIGSGPNFHGLGIKTATGNSGNLYTLSHPMALMKMRIFNSANNGVLSLDVGQSKLDTVNGSVMRPVGLRLTSWAKCFQTPASASSSSIVQYFMSVKSDGIVLVLNGDPGNSGKLGTAHVSAFTPVDPTYDVFPVAFNASVNDDTGTGTGAQQNAVQYYYWALRRRQDGSEGSRDWQTRWMRSDAGNAANVYTGFQGFTAGDVNTATVDTSTGVVAAAPLLLSAGGIQEFSGASISMLPSRQVKPGPDGKWHLYGHVFTDTGMGDSTSIGIDDRRHVRGTSSDRFYYLPSDGWSNGDELTDTVSGVKYLLVMPDYPGWVGLRNRTTASTFWGGGAIAEV